MVGRRSVCALVCLVAVAASAASPPGATGLPARDCGTLDDFKLRVEAATQEQDPDVLIASITELQSHLVECYDEMKSTITLTQVDNTSFEMSTKPNPAFDEERKRVLQEQLEAARIALTGEDESASEGSGHVGYHEEGIEFDEPAATAAYATGGEEAAAFATGSAFATGVAAGGEEFELAATASEGDVDQASVVAATATERSFAATDATGVATASVDDMPAPIAKSAATGSASPELVLAAEHTPSAEECMQQYAAIVHAQEAHRGADAAIDTAAQRVEDNLAHVHAACWEVVLRGMEQGALQSDLKAEDVVKTMAALGHTGSTGAAAVLSTAAVEEILATAEAAPQEGATAAPQEGAMATASSSGQGHAFADGEADGPLDADTETSASAAATAVAAEPAQSTGVEASAEQGIAADSASVSSGEISSATGVATGTPTEGAPSSGASADQAQEVQAATAASSAATGTASSDDAAASETDSTEKLGEELVAEEGAEHLHTLEELDRATDAAMAAESADGQVSGASDSFGEPEAVARMVFEVLAEVRVKEPILATSPLQSVSASCGTAQTRRWYMVAVTDRDAAQQRVASAVCAMNDALRTVSALGQRHLSAVEMLEHEVHLGEATARKSAELDGVVAQTASPPHSSRAAATLRSHMVSLDHARNEARASVTAVANAAKDYLPVVKQLVATVDAAAEHVTPLSDSEYNAIISDPKAAVRALTPALPSAGPTTATTLGDALVSEESSGDDLVMAATGFASAEMLEVPEMQDAEQKLMLPEQLRAREAHVSIDTVTQQTLEAETAVHEERAHALLLAIRQLELRVNDAAATGELLADELTTAVETLAATHARVLAAASRCEATNGAASSTAGMLVAQL